MKYRWIVNFLVLLVLFAIENWLPTPPPSPPPQTQVLGAEATPDPQEIAQLEAVGKEAAGIPTDCQVDWTFYADKERVKVTRVIDGDTIVVTGNRRVRYIGIDAPETTDPRKPLQCYGDTAKAENSRLVLNKEVYLEKDVSNTDSFGRLLRYVYVGGGTCNSELMFVNRSLVNRGYASATPYPPDVKYENTFEVDELRARESGIGLWGACDASSSATVKSMSEK